jgi:P27 family predicted phage terminase small subunit
LKKAPNPPSDLGKYGKEYWNRIAPILIEIESLTELHLETFKTLCSCWNDYCELSAWMKKNPTQTVFETQRGYMQEHPNVRLRQRALQNLTRLWPKFGLTPEALAKLGKHGGAAASKMANPLQQFAAEKYDDDELE